MKIGFFGTPEHSAYLLNELLKQGYEISFVVTNPDKPTGRKQELTPSPVKTLALQNHIPVIQPKSLKNAEAISEILKYNVDINIIYAYGALIPKEIFDSPPGGSINLHGSLLPEFRGASPVQAAILANYTKTGFTLQYITEELDAGEIISTGEVEITLDDTFGTLIEKITQLATKEILRLLSTYNGKRFPSKPQDHSKATYCKKIKPEDRKLDFSKTQMEIHNKIRAFNPTHICYCEFRGKRLNIYKTRISQEESSLTFGSLVKLDKKTLGFVCGDRKILILDEVQAENKKVMSGTDFLNGIRFIEGEKLL